MPNGDEEQLARQRRETAWNLYLAFRTYPEISAALCRPEEERASGITGIAHSEYHTALGRAQYLAEKHNFMSKALSDALSPAGIHLIVLALRMEAAFEEKCPELPNKLPLYNAAMQQRIDEHKPISFGFSDGPDGPLPWIRIRPLSFPNVYVFRYSMIRELSALYLWLREQYEDSQQRKQEAWRTFQERYPGALEDETPNEEMERRYLRSLPREGAISLPTLQRHARWWAAYRDEGMSMYQIGQRENEDGADIRHAIRVLETRHRLSHDRG